MYAIFFFYIEANYENIVSTAVQRTMPRECVKKITKIYKNEPCLWHIKSKDYRDMTKKEGTYGR